MPAATVEASVTGPRAGGGYLNLTVLFVELPREGEKIIIDDGIVYEVTQVARWIDTLASTAEFGQDVTARAFEKEINVSVKEYRP